MPRVQLTEYLDADIALTTALETDPDVMRELGGPIPADRIPGIHACRLGDPWWLKIVAADAGDAAVGTIGIWEKQLDGAVVHETCWMILPAVRLRTARRARFRLLRPDAALQPLAPRRRPMSCGGRPCLKRHD